MMTHSASTPQEQRQRQEIRIIIIYSNRRRKCLTFGMT
jgi:hypothetical protein